MIHNYFDPGSLQTAFGINPMEQNFNFNLEQANYQTSPDLLGSIKNLNRFGGKAESQFGQMIDPYSAYNQGQYNLLRGQVADTAQQTTNNMNQQMSARGIGGGGISNLMENMNINRGGEQIRLGFGDIQKQSLLGAAQFGQLTTDAYGQAGGLGSDIDARKLNANMFNAQQSNDYNQYLQMAQYNQDVQNRNARGSFANSAMSMVGSAAGAKLAFMCVPEGTKIDTPSGEVKIENLKAGDRIIGYDGKTVNLMQKHEYNENPKVKRFLKFTFDDESVLDLCDMHKIKGIRSKNYNIGDIIFGKMVKAIDMYSGVNRSYDLLTDDRGYRISGIPINSMIEEMAKFANFGYPRIDYSRYSININEVAQ